MTPGSGSLLRASAAVELPELLAAGFGAAGAQAQRLRPRAPLEPHSACTTHAPASAALRLCAYPFAKKLQALQVAL